MSKIDWVRALNQEATVASPEDRRILSLLVWNLCLSIQSEEEKEN